MWIIELTAFCNYKSMNISLFGSTWKCSTNSVVLDREYFMQLSKLRNLESTLAQGPKMRNLESTDPPPLRLKIGVITFLQLYPFPSWANWNRKISNDKAVRMVKTNPGLDQIRRNFRVYRAAIRHNISQERFSWKMVSNF